MRKSRWAASPTSCPTWRIIVTSGSVASGGPSTCRAPITTAPSPGFAPVSRRWNGNSAGYPEYVLHQMVTVMKGGEEVKISKRAGTYVTVRDLMDEVGGDALRYFFLMRSGDSQLVFDMDLARKQTEENPVYYVQMAHARMAGIFRTAGVRRPTFSWTTPTLRAPPARRRTGTDEKARAEFPGTVARAAETGSPIGSWVPR